MAALRAWTFRAWMFRARTFGTALGELPEWDGGLLQSLMTAEVGLEAVLTGSFARESVESGPTFVRSADAIQRFLDGGSARSGNERAVRARAMGVDGAASRHVGERAQGTREVGEEATSLAREGSEGAQTKAEGDESAVTFGGSVRGARTKV